MYNFSSAMEFNLYRHCSIKCVLILLTAINIFAKQLPNSWSFLSDSESYLKINGTTNIGQLLKFRFKSYDYQARLLQAKLGTHWLSFHLDSGHLAVYVDLKKTVIPRLDDTKVNDMEWHQLKLVIDHLGGVTIWLDRIVFFLPLSHEVSDKRFLWDNVWFGASTKESKDINKVQNSFIGCLHLMHPHSKMVNHLGNNAVDKGRFVVNGCLDACVIQTCANGGKCINHVNHAACDCLGTGFDGPTCEQESPIIYMDGKSFIAFDTAENPDSNNQEFITMRIRTTSNSGLLLATSFAKDHVVIQIVDGKVEVSLDFGGGTVKFESGTTVNDGLWHSLKLDRHLRLVSLHVDGHLVGSSSLSTPMLQLEMTGGEELIYFGGSKKEPINKRVENKQNFTGCLQQVRFNHVDVIHSILYLNDWRLSFYGDRSRTCEKSE